MSRYLVFRALAACLAVLTVLVGGSFASPSIVWAQAKKPIAVGVIEGPQGDATRRRVLQTLKKTGSYEVTDAEDLRPTADKGAYSAMAQALQVDAIIVGKVTRGGDLTLSVIAPDGSLIEDVKLKGKSLKGLQKVIDNELEIALAGPLAAKKGAKPDKAAAKAEPVPEDEEEEAPPEDEEEAKPEGGGEEEKPSEEAADAPSVDESKPGRRPLELLIGGRLYNRDFQYQDLQSSNVFPYKLAIAPAIIASTRIYPFAFFRDDALGNLGIMAKLEVGIATSTNYAEPQPDGSQLVHPLNTGTSEWQVGLRGRLPLDAHEFGIFGSYGAHSFVLVGDEGPTATEPNRPYPLVPDVNYTFLRFGLDGRVRIKKLTLGGHFAPRFLTSMKNIDQSGFWFPGATGSGIDFGAFLGYELLKFMDVAVGADFLRYGFDFNGIPNDAGLPGSPAPLIAGGATDTYLSGWLGIIFHYDGPASAANGSVSVDVAPSSGAEPADAEPADAEE